MKKDLTLTQKNFDGLLDWLSENRDEAGKQYEMIRNGLIRFFRFRGCADPQALADETINRVAAKVSTFDTSKNVKTITYFYGFASKVYLEYLRTVKNRDVPLEAALFSASAKFETPVSANSESDCLEKCLAKLAPDDSRLIVQYYRLEKEEKFEGRKKLAEKLNLKMAALHTRVYRIRNALRECIEDCLK